VEETTIGTPPVTPWIGFAVVAVVPAAVAATVFEVVAPAAILILRLFDASNCRLVSDAFETGCVTDELSTFSAPAAEIAAFCAGVVPSESCVTLGVAIEPDESTVTVPLTATATPPVTPWIGAAVVAVVPAAVALDEVVATEPVIETAPLTGIATPPVTP